MIGSIVRPVHRMGRVAQAISGGDLHTVLDYRSRDALGELADSIREMQSALISDIARREEAEADLIATQGPMFWIPGLVLRSGHFQPWDGRRRPPY